MFDTLLGGVAGLSLMASHGAVPEPSDTAFELRAEWLGKACQLPASFQVTLVNTGEAAFDVPRDSIARYGEAINFAAEVDGQRGGSELYHPLPRPQSYFVGSNFLRLEPGQSHTYLVEFDGSLGPVGAPPPAGPWAGRIVFYYTLSDAQARRIPTLPDLLVMDPAAVVYSNRLVCP